MCDNWSNQSIDLSSWMVMVLWVWSYSRCPVACKGALSLVGLGVVRRYIVQGIIASSRPQWVGESDVCAPVWKGGINVQPGSANALTLYQLAVSFEQYGVKASRPYPYRLLPGCGGGHVNTCSLGIRHVGVGKLASPRFHFFLSVIFYSHESFQTSENTWVTSCSV